MNSTGSCHGRLLLVNTLVTDFMVTTVTHAMIKRGMTCNVGVPVRIGALTIEVAPPFASPSRGRNMAGITLTVLPKCSGAGCLGMRVGRALVIAHNLGAPVAAHLHKTGTANTVVERLVAALVRVRIRLPRARIIAPFDAIAAAVLVVSTIAGTIVPNIKDAVFVGFGVSRARFASEHAFLVGDIPGKSAVAETMIKSRVTINVWILVRMRGTFVVTPSNTSLIRIFIET
jgi:hypothetical protein